MKKMVYTLAVAIFIFSAMVITPAIAESSSNEKIPVIIGFKGKADASIVKAHGGEIKYEYDLIPAIAASLPEKAINGLKNNPNVEYIEEDAEVHVSKKLPVQIFPWGVLRVWDESVDDAYTGSGVKVAVIDTGIDYTHPDLDVKGGKSFVSYTSDYKDDNGHGTHVAGTIAALDNSFGVIGVAPEANLYALKVLNRRGSGYTSDIVAAIDWSIKNDIDVISMSLGSDADVQALHDECDKAYAEGITIVAAAGNDANEVDYPAAYGSVIAVSAIDSNNVIAYFSSRGPEVELTAPGVDVYSTYLRNSYTTMSGTSMATPHVSGVVALLLSANPSLEPDDVRIVLGETATDLGDTGRDELYGFGLVNAYDAIESFN